MREEHEVCLAKALGTERKRRECTKPRAFRVPSGREGVGHMGARGLLAILP